MMDMRSLTILIYLISGCLQLSAFVICIAQITKVRAYKSGWALLSAGLLLMLARRIQPMYIASNGGVYLINDALLALVISTLLLSGILGVRCLLEMMQRQEILLAKMVRHDALTGVLSRNAILDQAKIVMERCQRLNKPIAILVFDIDKFKSINDQYGHAAGDAALNHFVFICKQSLRNIDLFGRIGGDEFLAIIPETDLDVIKTISERLIKQVRDSEFNFENHQLSISTSIGIAIFDSIFMATQQTTPAGELVDKLIKIADMNMYTAKRVSGNQAYLSSNQMDNVGLFIN